MRMLRAAVALLLTAACGPATSSNVSIYETPEQHAAGIRAHDNAEIFKTAEAAFQRGDLDAAEKGYREVAQRDPAAIQPRIRLAEIMKREHRYGEEERFLREALVIEPDRLHERYALVWALLHQRRVEEASKEFQALQTYGNQDEAMELRIRGAIALHGGRYEQATRWFDELLRLDPSDPAGHVGLGVVKAQAGDFDGSIQELDKAVALSPPRSAETAIAHYDLALAYYRKGDLQKAVDEGKLAVELDPWFMAARNNLAATYVQLGQRDDAKATLVDAIKLRPTYAPAHNNLGIVLLGMGDLPGAADELGKAIFHAPRVPSFHYNLALVKFKQGDRDGARAEFGEVVKLDKKDVEAERNLRWLEGLKAGTIQGTELPAAASHYSVDEFDE